MPSRRAKLEARTLTLLALVLCGAGAAFPQTAPGSAGAAPAEPLSIAIVVDTSSSLRAAYGSHGKGLRQALTRFLEAGAGRDQFTLMEASTRPALVLDWTEDGAAASKALSKLLSKREPGASSINDACALAAAKAASGKHVRRAVLVLSDGIDTTSEMTFEKVERLVKGSGVRLFAVEVGDRGGAGAARYEGGFRNLSRLAAASGGAVYTLKKAAELDAFLASVRAEMGR